jgi:hypothetical protein
MLVPESCSSKVLSVVGKNLHADHFMPISVDKANNLLF